MTLSRRQFLQVFGISIGSLALTKADLAYLAPKPPLYSDPIQGRTLVPTTVITTTGLKSLWADSIIPIYGTLNDHYQTDKGSILRRHVQPMNPLLPFDVTIPKTIPFDAEVAAPTATIHQYADINAPIVTRIGHGGIMTILDTLENTRSGWWYQVGNANQILGWTQGLHWRELNIQPITKNDLKLAIHRTQKKLAIIKDQRSIMEMDILLPDNLSAGAFKGWKRNLSGSVVSNEGQSLHGVPYHFATSIPEASQLYSVYWHNHFGDNHHLPTIELNVISGKYLFNNLHHEFSINVI